MAAVDEQGGSQNEAVNSKEHKAVVAHPLQEPFDDAECNEE